MGWFLVDKLVAGGLDDWEVKIADFVVLLGKVAKKLLNPKFTSREMYEQMNNEVSKIYLL